MAATGNRIGANVDRLVWIDPLSFAAKAGPKNAMARTTATMTGKPPPPPPLAISVTVPCTQDGIEALAPLDELRLSDIEQESQRVLRLLQWSRHPVHGRTPAEDFEWVTSVLVQRARALRLSWAEIGEHMGMTPQGASKMAQR